jgi:hypothetical protein
MYIYVYIYRFIKMFILYSTMLFLKYIFAFFSPSPSGNRLFKDRYYGRFGSTTLDFLYGEKLTSSFDNTGTSGGSAGLGGGGSATGTGNGTQSGHIIVELPQDAPDNLYYACEFHSSMAGPVLVRTDNISFNPQASNYTLTTSDSGRLIEMSGGGTLTITDSSSFPVGFACDVLQTTTSQVTIAGTSFTPDSTPGLKLRTRWSSATLIKRSLNSWVVLGDLSA